MVQRGCLGHRLLSRQRSGSPHAEGGAVEFSAYQDAGISDATTVMSGAIGDFGRAVSAPLNETAHPDRSERMTVRLSKGAFGLAIGPMHRSVPAPAAPRRATAACHRQDQPRRAVPERDDLCILQPASVGGLTADLRVEQAVRDSSPRRSVPFTDGGHPRIGLVQLGVIQIRCRPGPPL